MSRNESVDRASSKPDTFTSNRGLAIEEALIFEIGRTEVTGVDIAEPAEFTPRLGGLERKSIGLPGLSEPETMRHYVRLSQKNYAIDAGIYPLGSCTMKHNPRLNEQMARLPGFADVHPLQPQSTVQGALELIAELSRWLIELTGMHAVAMSPKAGAHGEACGMMAIKAAIAAKGEGDRRNVVLVPESAHGTNPATAALIGFTVRQIPAAADGTVSRCRRRGGARSGCRRDHADQSEHLRIVRARGRRHRRGRACGRRLSSIVTARISMRSSARRGPATSASMRCTSISTRRFRRRMAAAGPGAGPVVFSQRLARYAPVPFIVADGPGLRLVEHAEGSESFGRITAFHGQMGMFVRALSYMLSHGGDGLRQAAEDAVLNANYVRVSLADLMSLPFGDRPCMHEALFDDGWLKGTGVTTLDFAKAMIDEGFHPMTIYFPLVVHGAMLIEPTESESKASLDLFIATLRDLAMRARRGETRALRRRAALCAAPAARRDAGGTQSDPALAEAGAGRGTARRRNRPVFQI